MFLAVGLALLVGSMILTFILRPRTESGAPLSDTGAVAAALTISGGIALGTGMTIAFFL